MNTPQKEEPEQEEEVEEQQQQEEGLEITASQYEDKMLKPTTTTTTTTDSQEESTGGVPHPPMTVTVDNTNDNDKTNDNDDDGDAPNNIRTTATATDTPPKTNTSPTTGNNLQQVPLTVVRAVVPRMERLPWPRFFRLSGLVALPTLLYILCFTRMGFGMDCFYYLADRYGDDYAHVVGGATALLFLTLYLLDIEVWPWIGLQRFCGLLFIVGSMLTVLLLTGDYPYGPICLFAAITPLFLIFMNSSYLPTTCCFGTITMTRYRTREYVRSLSGPLFCISVLTGLVWLIWTFVRDENEYNQVTKVVFAQATGCQPNLEDYPHCSASYTASSYENEEKNDDNIGFNSTNSTLYNATNSTEEDDNTDDNAIHWDGSSSEEEEEEVCFGVIESPPSFFFRNNTECDSSCPLDVYDDCLNPFILWAGPLLVGMVLFFLSFFCTFIRVTTTTNNSNNSGMNNNSSNSNASTNSNSNNSTADILNFGKLWIFLLFVMWLTASLAGVAAGLSSALLAMTLASFVGSVILVAMTRSREESKTQAKELWTSVNTKYGVYMDVARGLFLVTCTPFIAIYLVLSVLNQGVRKCRLPCSKPIITPEARQDFVTKRTRQHMTTFLSWDRTKVLTYAVYWGIAFMMLQVIVAQFTVLFLSWLIDSTSSLNVGVVTAVLVMVGMIMFLLPPVPGVPIYLTLGIVILATGRDVFGLVGSMAYAAAVSLALKLLACTVQQVLIGENLARYVSVRKLVQINSTIIKAMKLILAQPGMGMDKVCILVGGPDWPTSVLCGIMGLNLVPVLVGTLPVILLIIPTMLTGSFTYMAGIVKEDNETLEFPSAGVLATVFAAIAAIVQLGAMILAAYYLEQTTSKRADEIAAIEDDLEVAELEANEVEFNNCYSKVTQWKCLPGLAKATLYMSFICMVVCCYLVQLFSNSCFAEYQLTYTIDEDLDGNWLNFVLFLGWVAIALFLVSCVLLVCFMAWASVKAKKELSTVPARSKKDGNAAGAEEQAAPANEGR